MFALLLTILLVDDDPLAAQLKTAKEEYVQRLEALKEPTREWFNAQREAREGKRALLQELDDLLISFDKNGEPPVDLPPALRLRYAEAAKHLEGWYATAVREYRQAKLDPKAEAIANEWLQFRIDGRGTMQPEIKDGQAHLVIARCSRMALTIVPPNGTAAGGIIVQRGANEADDSQYWNVHVRRIGRTAFLAFEMPKYRLWMHVNKQSPNMGDVMVLWHGDGTSDNERWLPLQRGAYLNLRSAQSGYLLSIREGSRRPDEQALQWQPTGADDQRFRILPVRVPAK